MTDTLTVATHFEDLSQFSTGLVDRVDEDRLILYGPTAYPEGERVDFAVLLLDGSPALEGQARILATVDGGEERDPSARYDIYLDGLELGGMAQAVYERILLARQSLASGEPPTGEIDVSELERMEAEVAEAPPAEQAWEEPPLSVAPEVAASEPEEDFGGESTVVAADPQALADAYEAERELAGGGDASEPAPDASDWAEPVEAAQAEPEDASDWAEPVEAAEPQAAQAEPEDASDWAEPADADYAPVDTSDLASPLEDVEASVDGPDAGTTAALAGDPSIPPPAPADPGGFQLPTIPSGALTRPSREPAWWPAPAERPEAREVSGYFAYEGELPIPPVPPRPELDPSYRVGPAPQPAAGADVAITEAEAEPVEVDMQPAAEASEAVDLEADDSTRQVEMPEAEIAGGEFEAEAGEAVELAEADTAFEIDEIDIDGTDAALDVAEVDIEETPQADVAEVDIEETAQADVELDELAAIDIDEPSDELEPG